MLKHPIQALERYFYHREPRRKTHPFAWGIEHLGGEPSKDEPRTFLRCYADQALAASERFFSTGPAEWYKLEEGVLSYPSAIQSAFPENNTVTARWFPAQDSISPSQEPPKGVMAGRPAVVVLPQWNAEWEAHVNICSFLNRFGISALRLSLPYHNQRKPPGIERADYMVSPNVGLTLQASRQAVLDARRGLRWLEQQGYNRLGILGTSIGSSVAYVTLCHEPAMRAGVFLHVSTYFADVVRAGLTTSHVWRGLEGQVSAEELRRYWAPISPYPYVPRLKGAGKKLLLVSGRYDLSFPFEFSRQLWQTMERHGIPYEKLVLPCGHYTLAHFPFSYWAGLRFLRFLRRALA